MKKILLIVVLVALVGAGGYAWVKRGGAQSTGASPKSDIPAAVKSAAKVQAVAKVVPVRSSQLTFAGDGVVAEVLVAEGDKVKAGQVLARLVSDRQAAGVAQATAALAQAQARLADLQAPPRSEEIAAAQAAVDLAKAGLAKLLQGPTAAEIAQAEALLARAQANLINEQAKQSPNSQQLLLLRADLHTAQTQLQTLKQGASAADVAQAEAGVRQAEANLALRQAGPRAGELAVAQAGIASAEPQVSSARLALADMEMRSPMDGTVAAINLKVGEAVMRGTAPVQVADLGAWQIETEDLTELRVVGIIEGAPVTIRFDALPDVTLEGTVSRIKTVGEKKQGDVLYTVIVKPKQMDPRIRWNMSANLSFD